jgi:YgiT-type zinc finger domain-containing protein
MREIRCNTCGSNRYEERRIDYLYSHQGKYLLVPNTPVEICLECGMIYYDAAVLKEIERRCFAIHQQKEMPDSRLKFPARVTRKELFVKGRTRIFLKSP